MSIINSYTYYTNNKLPQSLDKKITYRSIKESIDYKKLINKLKVNQSNQFLKISKQLNLIDIKNTEFDNNLEHQANKNFSNQMAKSSYNFFKSNNKKYFSSRNCPKLDYEKIRDENIKLKLKLHKVNKDNNLLKVEMNKFKEDNKKAIYLLESVLLNSKANIDDIKKYVIYVKDLDINNLCNYDIDSKTHSETNKLLSNYNLNLKDCDLSKIKESLINLRLKEYIFDLKLRLNFLDNELNQYKKNIKILNYKTLISDNNNLKEKLKSITNCYINLKNKKENNEFIINNKLNSNNINLRNTNYCLIDKENQLNNNILINANYNQAYKPFEENNKMLFLENLKLKNEIEELNKTNNNSLFEVNRLKKEIDDLEIKCKNTENKIIIDLNNKILNLNNVIKKQNSDILSLNDRIHNYIKYEKEITLLYGDIKNFNLKIAELEDKNCRLTKDILEYKSDNAALINKQKDLQRNLTFKNKVTLKTNNNDSICLKKSKIILSSNQLHIVDELNNMDSINKANNILDEKEKVIDLNNSLRILDLKPDNEEKLNSESNLINSNSIKDTKDNQFIENCIKYKKSKDDIKQNISINSNVDSINYNNKSNIKEEINNKKSINSLSSKNNKDNSCDEFIINDTKNNFLSKDSKDVLKSNNIVSSQIDNNKENIIVSNNSNIINNNLDNKNTSTNHNNYDNENIIKPKAKKMFTVITEEGDISLEENNNSPNNFKLKKTNNSLNKKKLSNILNNENNNYNSPGSAKILKLGSDLIKKPKYSINIHSSEEQTINPLHNFYIINKKEEINSFISDNKLNVNNCKFNKLPTLDKVLTDKISKLEDFDKMMDDPEILKLFEKHKIDIKN